MKPIVEKFKKEGKFEEASLGIFAYDKNVLPYLYKDTKISNLKDGIYVVQVLKNSAANKAGIQEADILTKIDNKSLKRMCDLRSYIYSKNKDDEVNIELQRNNITLNIKVKLN